jgi:hypothetical protein
MDHRSVDGFGRTCKWHRTDREGRNVSHVKQCTYPQCGYDLYAKELCLRHYHQHRTTGRLTAIKRRRPGQLVCDFAGCARPYRAAGLCFAHYMQLQRHGKLMAISTEPRFVTCAFPSCNRPRLAKGWCAGHYNQHRLAQEIRPLRLRDPDRDCLVAGCPGRHYGNGLCKNHHRKLAAYGLEPAELALVMAAAGCAICRRPWGAPATRSPCIDHDHRTGQVRGVLCGGCNFGIGQFDDDPVRLESAAGYLRDHQRGNSRT